VHRVNDVARSRGTAAAARSYHSVGNLNSLDMDHSPRFASDKRHSLIDSSADSTTEGDSSQKSHKSTVYLHATTGNIRSTATVVHVRSGPSVPAVLSFHSTSPRRSVFPSYIVCYGRPGDSVRFDQFRPSSTSSRPLSRVRYACLFIDGHYA